MIGGADETEQDTFEYLEIQDTITEKVVCLKCYLEKNSATTSASPAPLIDLEILLFNLHLPLDLNLSYLDILEICLSSKHFGTLVRQLSTQTPN